jgi:cytochrome P450
LSLHFHDYFESYWGKQSGIDSHPPSSIVGNGIIGGGDHVLPMQYGQQWRTARRAVHHYFPTSMVMSDHLPIVEAEPVQMVNDLISELEGHMQHPKRFGQGITTEMAEIQNV